MRLLDAQAKAEYRERLQELDEDLEEARVFNDPERVARAKQEIEFLAGELAGAVGLGGRDRKAASVSERARVNVTRAIKPHLGASKTTPPSWEVICVRPCAPAPSAPTSPILGLHDLAGLAVYLLGDRSALLNGRLDPHAFLMKRPPRRGSPRPRRCRR